VLYLDTDLRLFRCPALPDVLAEVGREDGGPRFGTIECERCYYQGVRDFDAIYHLLGCLDGALTGLAAGDVRPAAKLVGRRAWLALRDAWDIRGSGLM
jgi:hypothetical protein